MFEKKLLQKNYENKFLQNNRQDLNNSTNNNSPYLFRKLAKNNGSKSTTRINTKISLNKSTYKSNRNEIAEKFIDKKNNKLKKITKENIEKNKNDEDKNYSFHKRLNLEIEIKGNINDLNNSSTTKKNENNIYFRNHDNAKSLNNYKNKQNLSDNRIIYKSPIYLPTKILNEILIEEVKIKEPIVNIDSDKIK